MPRSSSTAAPSRTSTRPGACACKRDDLVTFQVDGTHGSAVAGLTRCFTQHRVNTPRPVWNPDVPQTMNFEQQWEEVPDNQVYDNGFKLQWEEFIRHVVDGAPWKLDLIEGAKGVQLAELGLKSWQERRWIDVPALLGGESACSSRRLMTTINLPTCRRRVEDYAIQNAPAARRRGARRSAPTRQPHRLFGSARRRRSACRQRSLARCRDRLGQDHRVPPLLWDLGLGVAEAMDTAQRGMGLDWPTALELIRRSLDAAKGRPGALIASGAGTDHLAPGADVTVDDVIRAYEEQIEAIEAMGGRIILMAQPRARARRARTGRLSAGLRPHPVAGEGAGDHPLAWRDVRSGARRLLGLADHWRRWIPRSP